MIEFKNLKEEYEKNIYEKKMSLKVFQKLNPDFVFPNNPYPSFEELEEKFNSNFNQREKLNKKNNDVKNLTKWSKRIIGLIDIVLFFTFNLYAKVDGNSKFINIRTGPSNGIGIPLSMALGQALGIGSIIALSQISKRIIKVIEQERAELKQEYNKSLMLDKSSVFLSEIENNKEIQNIFKVEKKLTNKKFLKKKHLFGNKNVEKNCENENLFN